MQSRRSLLIWKVFGQRTRRLEQRRLPHETVPGDPTIAAAARASRSPTRRRTASVPTSAYTGSIMPPPEAVAGTYVGPDGKKIKVAPLTDEDRRTLVRWIDLGCPIDLDYDPANPEKRGYGWMLRRQPADADADLSARRRNEPLTRILVGMHDYDTGLDVDSFEVVADFAIDGVAAGENLAKKFRSVAPGVWELKLSRPITDLPRGKLTVAIKDRQGNVTRIERTFSVAARMSKE